MSYHFDLKMSSERKSCGRAAKKIHDLGKILVKEELTAKYKQASSIALYVLFVQIHTHTIVINVICGVSKNFST